MEDGRTCSRPVLQHDRHRLVGELRVPLQIAVESQKHASVCVVAESPGTHQRDVIAHQVAEHAAKVRQLSQRFQRPVGLGGEERPHDRRATLYQVLGVQLRDRVARDRPFAHEEVEESIDDAGTVKKRERRPLPTALLQPTFQRLQAYVRRCALASSHNILEATKHATISLRSLRMMNPALSQKALDRTGIPIGPGSHARTSGISRAIARRSSVASFRYASVASSDRWPSKSPITLRDTDALSRLTARAWRKV